MAAESGQPDGKDLPLQVDNDPSFSSPDRHPRSWTRRRHRLQRACTPRARTAGGSRRATRGQRPDVVGGRRPFTKSRPAVTPSSPVAGTWSRAPRPFRWAAEPFAASYTVEVYRNNDLTFSAANRVFSATVKTTAYAPSVPDPRRGDAVRVAGPSQRRVRQPGPVVGRADVLLRRAWRRTCSAQQPASG